MISPVLKIKGRRCLIFSLRVFFNFDENFRGNQTLLFLLQYAVNAMLKKIKPIGKKTNDWYFQILSYKRTKSTIILFKS